MRARSRPAGVRPPRARVRARRRSCRDRAAERASSARESGRIRRGADTSASVAVGPGVPNVLGERRVEDERLLVDHEHMAPNVGEARAREGRRRRAARVRSCGSSCRTSRSAIVDLPSPLRPTIATRSPGGTSSDTPSSTGPPRPNANVTSSSVRRAARRRQRHRVGRFDDVDRRVENLAHAPERHARRREARVETHQRLNRPDEPHLVGDERDERAHRDRVIDHAHAADEKHERRFRPRAADPGTPPDRYVSRRIDISASMNASLRARKRDASRSCALNADDHLHPEQRLDEEAADVGAPVAHAGDRGLEPRAIAHERPERDRQHREAHEKQHAIEAEQNDDAADEEDHVADPRQRDLRGDALDLADVGVECASRSGRSASRRRSAATAAAAGGRAPAACRTGSRPTCACRPARSRR